MNIGYCISLGYCKMKVQAFQETRDFHTTMNVIKVENREFVHNRTMFQNGHRNFINKNSAKKLYSAMLDYRIIFILFMHVTCSMQDPKVLLIDYTACPLLCKKVINIYLRNALQFWCYCV